MSSLKELKVREKLIEDFIRANNVFKSATLSKLNKYKKEVEISDDILKVTPKYIFDNYIKKMQDSKTLNLILGCDEGMCSSFYNAIYNYLRIRLRDIGEHFIVLGKKFESFLKNIDNVFCKKMILNDREIYEFSDYISNYIEEQNITTFIIHYMHKSKIIKEKVIILRDVNKKMEFHSRFFIYCMINIAIKRSLYSENKERLLSLENSSSKIQEMLKKIKLQFNRLRQEKITNSLNEIVSGLFI